MDSTEREDNAAVTSGNALERNVFKLLQREPLASLLDSLLNPKECSDVLGESMVSTLVEDVAVLGKIDVKVVFATKSTSLAHGEERLSPTNSKLNVNGDKRTNTKDNVSAVLGEEDVLARNAPKPRETADGLDTLSPTHGTRIVNGDKKTTNPDKDSVVNSTEFAKTTDAMFPEETVFGEEKLFPFKIPLFVTLLDFPSLLPRRSAVLPPRDVSTRKDPRNVVLLHVFAD